VGRPTAWGKGLQGSDASATPEAISGPSFAAVSIGETETCGLTPSGATYCWQGLTFSSPTAVAGAPVLGRLGVGEDPFCGVAPSGVGYCWGWNGYGDLGNDSSSGTPTVSPAAVAGGLTLATISARFESHACGVTTSGAAYCWGLNDQGQLGLGTNTGPQQCLFSAPCSTTPAAVTGGLTFTAVSTGGYHTCGLATSGAAYCWGQNNRGQLGIGSTTGPQQCAVSGGPISCSTTPVPVGDGTPFAALSAGGNHTCALTQSGAAYCWGSNMYGQLGLGDTSYSVATPSPVTGDLSFTAISAGDSHTCGLVASGLAYCWGATTCGTVPGTYKCVGPSGPGP